MQKVSLYISVLIVLGFFILATYLLVSSSFSYINIEMRIVFAAFLYLYGTFRIVWVITKHKRRASDDDE